MRLDGQDWIDRVIARDGTWEPPAHFVDRVAMQAFQECLEVRRRLARERPDVAAARAAWRNQQSDLSPERLVFIDETWATTTMARRHGRARRGQRRAIRRGSRLRPVWTWWECRRGRACGDQRRPGG